MVNEDKLGSFWVSTWRCYYMLLPNMEIHLRIWWDPYCSKYFLKLINLGANLGGPKQTRFCLGRTEEHVIKKDVSWCRHWKLVLAALIQMILGKTDLDSGFKKTKYADVRQQHIWFRNTMKNSKAKANAEPFLNLFNLKHPETEHGLGIRRKETKLEQCSIQ